MLHLIEESSVIKKESVAKKNNLKPWEKWGVFVQLIRHVKFVSKEQDPSCLCNIKEKVAFQHANLIYLEISTLDSDWKKEGRFATANYVEVKSHTSLEATVLFNDPQISC